MYVYCICITLIVLRCCRRKVLETVLQIAKRDFSLKLSTREYSNQNTQSLYLLPPYIIKIIYN